MINYLFAFVVGVIPGLIIGIKIGKPAVKIGKLKQKGGNHNSMDPELDLGFEKRKRRFFLTKIFKRHEKN